MPIKRYISKIVEVEAIEWTGQNLEEIKNFCNGLAHYDYVKKKLFIETIEGTSPATIGDFITRGTHGEFYPIKPFVMAAKYDEVQL